ncbi:hypothetical protein LCGC14_1064510 [marine sediment metagenome]|uniref:Uncharacterized protein n=1 Tax=marine sediment metagenome TaxID=412755 RepID=A0A0F9QR09_9ZZZZ
MLMEKGDGTFTGGQGDVICILELPEGTFHTAFFEEHPMSGQVKPIADEDFLRLKSKMHRTEGSETLEEEQSKLDEMRAKIDIPDSNVIRDKAIKVVDPVNIWVVPNWIREKRPIGELV